MKRTHNPVKALFEQRTLNYETIISVLAQNAEENIVSLYIAQYKEAMRCMHYDYTRGYLTSALATHEILMNVVR